ncbi:SDR family NAD(P)-dependent oxidoreductase [Bradyrhizobium sp. AUGA SZCCT0283]|uniref:SDR family NAD(P)-dependent oxidoreductase n=1 Tax=Bradyrhizobium sp. AUGA SZCCT0283 TaxID=2807671 RepID=UPI001BAB81B3|nr:SDR family NAD(P)-dependent oxidoreductase [Bradyrhizobium sp. AUGA SZCCT0283]MBR1275950.1 SDR family NAD(P)-dependent oxidoreductase [Bradyrhizobium sp. AUGA SZCCT0283]
MSEKQIAVVVGAGPGLGNALVRRCAAAGMNVAAVSRKRRPPEMIEDRNLVRGYACDATVGVEVTSMFERVTAELGTPDLVVYNVGTWDRAGILDISDQLFERAWRTGCFGGFLVGREAVRTMLPRERGTIIFSGATGSIRGGAGFAAFAVPKFGLRALAQSMAREFGPRGLHIVHVIIDGMIGQEDGAESDDVLAPGAIAEAYFQLYRQQRSAWTHEIDVRPVGEKF